MKRNGSELVNEAIKDAKALKEAALNAAKNQIVESLTPAVRALLEKEIGGVLAEKRGVTGRVGPPNMSQRADYLSPKDQKWEESVEKGDTEMADEKKKDDKPELDLESLASFFPQMSEEPEPELDEMGNPIDPSMAAEAPALGAIPTLGEEPALDGLEGEEGEDKDMPKMEGKKKKDDEEDKEPMDEEIEISEAELRKVYEAALQTEAQVTKGFADMTKAGEIEDVMKDVDKGLADVKKGEHAWEKEEPPAKQDFMVKERVEALIRQGIAENKALRKGIQERDQMIKALASKLHETNLFNSKVLHVNRFLNSHAGKLTNEQKTVVLESIDKATTVEQVSMVYEAISKTFIAAQLSEGKSRKPTANAQRPRTSGTADPKALRESADRTQNSAYSRLAQLAGLGNLK